MVCEELAQKVGPSLYTVGHNDGEMSFSREGIVGGLCQAQVQRHLTADLAAAAAGA